MLALLMVSVATLYAMNQIHQFQCTASRVFDTSLPIKESIFRLESSLRKIDFLLHKRPSQRDYDVVRMIDAEVLRQKNIVSRLQLLAMEMPAVSRSVDLLEAQLRDYWDWREALGQDFPNAVPVALSEPVETRLAEFNDDTDRLIASQSSAIMDAVDHLTKMLLMLVLATAAFGIVVSGLYAITATKPLRKIRHALMQVGEGVLDQKLDLQGARELRELSCVVNKMQMKLRTQESARAEFLSLISHELKTPLASFQSGTELLRSGGAGVLCETQRKVVDIMHRQVIYLGLSIQEMLDMQAIQAQRLTMDIRPCMLSDIVKDALDRMLPLIAERNQRIRWRPASTDVQVLVDPGRTLQVLLNLLSNANKYSPPETIITLYARVNDAFCEYVEILIEDQGPGMSEQYLRSAFERFFQVPVQGAHQRGTGLGLAIVKEIVESQYGCVKLENLKPHGLRVRVRLPLRGPDEVREDCSAAYNAARVR